MESSSRSKNFDSQPHKLKETRGSRPFPNVKNTLNAKESRKEARASSQSSKRRSRSQEYPNVSRRRRASASAEYESTPLDVDVVDGILEFECSNAHLEEEVNKSLSSSSADCAKDTSVYENANSASRGSIRSKQQSRVLSSLVCSPYA